MAQVSAEKAPVHALNGLLAFTTRSTMAVPCAQRARARRAMTCRQQVRGSQISTPMTANVETAITLWRRMKALGTSVQHKVWSSARDEMVKLVQDERCQRFEKQRIARQVMKAEKMETV